jgi:hypothetical protein
LAVDQVRVLVVGEVHVDLLPAGAQNSEAHAVVVSPVIMWPIGWDAGP